MMNNKWLAALAAFTLLAPLSGCGATAAQTASAATQPGAAQTPAVQTAKTEVDPSGAVTIVLNGSTATVEGQGAAANGSVVTVTQAGTYRVSGTLTDGQLVVNAGKDDTVTLILDGAEISCSTGPGIYAKQAGETVLALADGSENSVQDGTAYVLAAGEDEPNAAVFSKDNLTITGAGALTVAGSYNNGITSKDDLVIESGALTVTAVNDAVRGRDSVTVLDGTLVLDAGGDGIQSNNDTDAEKGWVALLGGTYAITAGNDGIQAQTVLSVSGGEYTITTGGGSANAPAHAQSGGGRGGPGQAAQPTGDDEAAEETESSVSQKGLKAGTGLTISGGTFTLDTVDDGVHTNGDLSVTGGTFTVSTGDDGFHADSTLAIAEGTVTILTSYEGLEGNSVEIGGGTITLTASDDGINAAAQGGVMRFSGGSVTVNASGDGLDSNGDILMEGGTVTVYGPTSTGNGALDYDGQCTVTGGTLIAAGSAGMAQTASSSSTQPVLAVYFIGTQAAGTQVTLADASGAQVITAAPQKDFQFLLLSGAQLQQGGTYTLTAAGETLTDVTLTAMMTSVSSDGSAVSAGMAGGRGGMGGGRMGTPPAGTPAVS